MKTLSLVSLLISGLCSVKAALPKTYAEKGSKVIRIADADQVENGMEKLEHLQYNELFDFLSPPSVHTATDVFVPEAALVQILTFLEDYSFNYSILIEDVGKLMFEEKLENKQDDDMNWDSYHRYQTILNFVEQSVSQHSDVSQIEEIGTSHENRSIIVVKIGRQVENKVKPAVFIDGGIHGREWIAPALTTYFINELLNSSPTYSDILSEVDFYIVPVLNPDGYEYTHTGNRLWRKNRRPADSDSTCVGVDLNRNFGFHWGGDGSSYDKCSNFYNGPEAFSEPETRAMKDFIEGKRDAGVHWRAYFTIHSYGQQWAFPWSWTGDRIEDYDDLLKFAEIGVKALTITHGTEYKVGQATEILYPSSGVSDDWAKGSGIFKYSQTLEIRDAGEYGFFLPPEQIRDCALETWEAILATSHFIASEQIIV